jgi:transcriptional regulator with XRE-family HTH domain
VGASSSHPRNLSTASAVLDFSWSSQTSPLAVCTSVTIVTRRRRHWQNVLLNGKLPFMSDSIDRTLDAVGPRLKKLRLRRDITLAELAQQTGISVSTLSRLEAGLRRPTLEQLLPLASAYGATLDELVDAPPTGDPRINLRPIPCADGATVLPLTRRAGGIQAYKFILPSGGDDRGPDLRTHEGYDWVYVLNGILRLVLGEHDMMLTPGEAAEFDTSIPHWFGATRAEPVEYLSLVGRQGQRVHVRAAPAPRR